MIALRRPLALALWLLAFGAFVACDKGKPKQGETCENNKRTCESSARLLICVNGAFQADTCKGPKGCYEDKGLATCDITGDDPGDPCPRALEGFTGCRRDGKTRLTCKAGAYEAESCVGPDGCTLTQIGVATCDLGPPRQGGPCSGDPRIQYCDADGKGFMLCGSERKFVVAQKCPGPNGCKETGGGLVSCDPNGAFVAGDACVLLSTTCSADGSSQLRCEGGSFVAHECPGPERCTMGGTACDTGFAAVGAPCVEGKRACSDDKKSLLECKPTPPKKVLEGEPEATLAVKKKCKGECTPKDGALACD